MQKLATKIFIYASLTFGLLGVFTVLTAPGPDTPDTPFTQVLIRLLFINIFVILSSFAISVAGRYLNGK